MPTVTAFIGDVRAVMPRVPDDSIDLVLTSPPFLTLRNYLDPSHPDKAQEIGNETSPAEYIDTMLGLTAQWRRVLAEHGSLCVELGDTYAGSGGAGGDYQVGGLRAGQPVWPGSARRQAGADAKNTGNTSSGTPSDGDWPMKKSLCMVPEAYRLGLAYGINPLTGQPSPAGRWRLRNVTRWFRTNPPVGELHDKFRPGTSDMVMACISRTRYFNLDDVRTPTGEPVRITKVGQASASKGISGGDSGNPDKPRASHNDKGSPPLDTWIIPNSGYEGSHFAVFNPKLLVTPIIAMCPERVCKVCGEPSRPVVDTGDVLGRGRTSRSQAKQEALGEANRHGRFRPPDHSSRTVTGWTDCGHDAWRPGLILDPFGGSGTTAAIAAALGRDSVLIDLNAENLELVRHRLTQRVPDDPDVSIVIKSERSYVDRIVFEVEVTSTTDAIAQATGQGDIFSSPSLPSTSPATPSPAPTASPASPPTPAPTIIEIPPGARLVDMDLISSPSPSPSSAPPTPPSPSSSSSTEPTSTSPPSPPPTLYD